jgi:hypothetical protein
MATSCISFAVASGSFSAVCGRAEVKPMARMNMEAVPMSVATFGLSLSSSSSRRFFQSTSISVYASETEQEEVALDGILEVDGEEDTTDAELRPTVTGTQSLSLNGIDAAPDALQGSKLYVGNLPWTCDSQQLAEVFQDCGNVELVEVGTCRRNLFFLLFFSVTTAQ